MTLRGPLSALTKRHPGATDFVLSVGARGTGAPLALAANMLIARLLGPDRFGQYMTLLSVALVIANVAAYGLGPLLTREVAAAGSWGRTEVFRSTLPWALRLATGLAAAGMLLGLVWLTAGVYAPATTWAERLSAILIVPLFVLVTLASGVLAGLSRVAQSLAFGTMWKNAGLLLGAGILVSWRIDYTVAALLVQATALAATAIAAVVQVARLSDPRTSFDRAWITGGVTRTQRRHLRRAAGHFLVQSIALLLLWRLDVVMVNAIAGRTQAGLFAVAARLVQMPCLAGFVWGAWLQPRVSACLSLHDHANLRRLLLAAVVGSTGVTVVAGAIGWVLAPEIMGLMGAGYQGAVLPFRLLLVAHVFWAASVPFSAYLSMSGRERALARILWTQLLLALGLGIPEIKRVGAVGASVAWGVAIAAGSLAIITVGLRARQRDRAG